MPIGDVPWVAINQSGCFTRPQAYAEGWSIRQVRRRLSVGRWRVVAGSALADSALEIGAWQLASAVLLTWPGAVVSHGVAAALHGFPGPAPKLGTAVVARARTSRASGLKAYRVALPASDVGRIGGMSVTTRTRTALDQLAPSPISDARNLWAWLATRGVLTAADLDRAVVARARWTGTGQLRQLAAWARTGSLSAAEDQLHRILRQARLRGWQANVPVVIDGRTIAVADVLFEAARLVIEVDGWAAHGAREAFRRDRARQNDLVLAGYTVLRFTWEELARHPDRVAAVIRGALGGDREGK